MSPSFRPFTALPARLRVWGGLLLLLLGGGCAMSTLPPSPPPRPLHTPRPPTPTALPPPPTPWQRSNPGGGGAFNTAAVGPQGTFLVASDLSGAYLSRDWGRSWENIGAVQGLTVTHVASAALDPQDPLWMALGTEEGIFRSTDGGRSWHMVFPHGYIADIRLAPGDPSQGYATFHSAYDQADGQVLGTQDRGRTWHLLPNQGLPPGLHLLKLQVDPQNPERVFLLSGEGRFACGPARLFVSQDGGNSWHPVAPSLGQVLDFALDPLDPTRLYLTTYGDLWDPGYRCLHDDPRGGWLWVGQETQGTWHWTRISTPLGSRNLLLWPHPTRPETLRVLDMDERSLWQTRDGGGTWTLVSTREDWDPGWSGDGLAYGSSFNGDAKTWAPAPQDPDLLLWVDGQFVWATFDGGHTFGPLHTEQVTPGHWRSRGIDNIVPFDLALGPRGQRVYLALADLGLFFSTDGGVTWQNGNPALPTGAWEGYGGNGLAVLADPQRPLVAWLAQAPDLEEGPFTLLRTTDGGASWQPTAGLPNAPLSGLSLDPHSPTARRTLFVTAGGEVYRSTDDGLTWEAVLPCGGCRTTAVDPQRPLWVFAGGEAGLWRSRRGGDPGSWEPLHLDALERTSAPKPAPFWDTDWAGVARLAFDPHTPGRLYAALFGPQGGLFRSEDGGTSWTRLLSDPFVHDVLPLPGAPGPLLVATGSALYSGGYDRRSQGILLSPDDGNSWLPFNQGLTWPLAHRLAYTPGPPPRVWAALPGLGYAWRPAPGAP